MVTGGKSCGFVYIYNYSVSPTNSTTALIAPCTTHGAHGQFFLIEGNREIKIHLDSIHGSASSCTVARNWVPGEVSYTSYGYGAINVDSWNYHMNVVGNVLGHSGMTGWIYEEVCPTDSDTDKAIYAIGYSGYNEYITGQDTYNNLLRHGNYDYVNQAIVWDVGIADHVVPNSYYYAAKPSYFGILAWPPIDPANPAYSSSITNIPAGYRYTFGSDPPAEVTGGRLNVTTGRIGRVTGKP